MTAQYISCARCGTRLTVGGHTRPNQCCRDCTQADPKYCARLMGTKIAMPPRHDNPLQKPTQAEEILEARRQARNARKRRRRAEGKRDAA